MTGRLIGIARHDRPRGPVETVERVLVTREEGVADNQRGTVRAGKAGRQISLIEAESWQAALGELGTAIDWQDRRANLLVEGLRIPRRPGTRIRIGEDCLIEVTMECDPCNRMEEVRPGLKAALAPDWRGGFLGMVIADGEIAVGDEIRIEE
jgi:MOSC domain-containing protein YiiM